MKIVHGISCLLMLSLFIFSSCKEPDPASDAVKTTGDLEEPLRIAAGTTYYVDDKNGNDSRNGTSTATAWKSVSKTNSVIFKPGDKILFRAGGSWTKQLHPQGIGRKWQSDCHRQLRDR
ncbi:hypothetical protein [Dyadobacter sp. NIV53]|uniref:hypothetical protein n=1 Tax=Dyadobacter sp. NIV53 TaxID=2861765 RepID=UPI001C88CF28|nr:hypothetical protein [Dyadobacter sp. NIV53]